MNRSKLKVIRTSLYSLTYRPDIDGLRAIAVLSVVVFHAFPGWVKGGFIGVDIFFVISGYLISMIIFSSLEKGAFSFLEFYTRRIRRIFPALFLVLLVSYTLGKFLLLPDEYKQLTKHIGSGVIFISNLVLKKETGYFDNLAETKPLLHLWSLSIEEQFYLFYPLLLWLAWKRKFNFIILIIAITCYSFYLNIKNINYKAASTFFSPHTRLWELMFGGALAWINLYLQHNHNLIKFKELLDRWLSIMIYRDPQEFYGKTLINIVSLVGVCLLLYGFFGLSNKMVFPGKWALIPVIGAVLIISAGSKAWFNRTILSNSIMVWFGLISFPLYLWHWPLLSFMYIIEGKLPAIHIRVIIVCMAITLAWLTIKFLEKNIRFGGKNKVKSICLIILMAILGVASYNAYLNNGITFKNKQFLKISQAIGEWGHPGSLKKFYFKDKRFYRQKSNLTETTLFIGDSSVEQYYVRLDELMKINPNNTNSIVFATGGGCLAIPNYTYDAVHQHCNYIMENAKQFALANLQVTNVVIGSLWGVYLRNSAISINSIVKRTKEYEGYLASLSLYIKELVKSGKKVFVILSIPNDTTLDPKCMVKRSIKNFPNVFKLQHISGVSRSKLYELYGMVEDDISKLARDAGAGVIQPLDYLCKGSICASIDNQGDPIYKDSGHLRGSFVSKYAKFIDLTVVDK